MPWQLDSIASKFRPNNKILVCSDLLSPATFIALDLNKDIVEISFNQTHDIDCGASIPTPMANLAIDAIKTLNLPYKTLPVTSSFQEYRITNYRENLPKILPALDPENKNGLAALLDKIGAFNITEQLAKLTMAAEKLKNAPKLSELAAPKLQFKETVEALCLKKNAAGEVVDIIKASEELKPPTIGSIKSLKKASKTLKQYE